MERIHFVAICNKKDIVNLPDEFVLYKGKKFIELLSVSITKKFTNDGFYPYIIISDKLARLKQQNRISVHLQNPSGKELSYITTTETLMSGFSIIIPWDQEKFFDIELVCVLNAEQFDQDYIREMNLVKA